MIPPKLRFSTHRSSLAAVVAACALTGCVPAQPATTKTVALDRKPVQPYAGVDPIASLDPCADQMEDLCGPLFNYYLVNHKLPAQLEEVQKYADPGQVLKFTCPVSGKHYLYSPEGLQAPGSNIRIYVYDAEPVHVFYNRTTNPWSNPKWYGKPNPADGGARKCIVNKPDAANGAPTLFTEEIPERAFRQFAPSAQPGPAPQTTPPPALTQPAQSQPAQ
jgi:hypothetical protein